MAPVVPRLEDIHVKKKFFSLNYSRGKSSNNCPQWVRISFSAPLLVMMHLLYLKDTTSIISSIQSTIPFKYDNTVCFSFNLHNLVAEVILKARNKASLNDLHKSSTIIFFLELNSDFTTSSSLSWNSLKWMVKRVGAIVKEKWHNTTEHQQNHRSPLIGQSAQVKSKNNFMTLTLTEWTPRRCCLSHVL